MSADAALGAAGCRPLVTVRGRSAAVTRGTGRTAGTYVATRPRPVRRRTRGERMARGTCAQRRVRVGGRRRRRGRLRGGLRAGRQSGAAATRRGPGGRGARGRRAD